MTDPASSGTDRAPRLWAIVGATGTGKSDLALDLAELLHRRGGAAEIVKAYAIFSALLLPIAALWISMGAAVLAYPSATPRQPMVHRIASVVLFGFAGSICYSLLAK